MNVIHQPTQHSCLAAVAAMITGEPIEEVFDSIGHTGSENNFRFLEVAGYLGRRGYILGAWGESYGLLRIPYRQPAVLIVASQNVHFTHAVFWTGEKVLDPTPGKPPMDLDDYTVREWWPVTRYED